MPKDQTKRFVYSMLTKLEQDFPEVECVIHVIHESGPNGFPDSLEIRARIGDEDYVGRIYADSNAYPIVKQQLVNTIKYRGLQNLLV